MVYYALTKQNLNKVGFTMLTLEQAIELILHNTKEAMEENGFSVVRPKDADKEAAPIRLLEDHSYVDWAGKKGQIRFEIFGNQAILYTCDLAAEDASEADFKKISTNFFDLDQFDERDMKSLGNELSETVRSKFGSKAQAKSKKTKTQTPISRSAVRNGNQSYDANTLANRLLGMYPELKPAYQENFEVYGEFLAEDFFENHATPLILKTIQGKNGKECNKLFRILNDIYESGLNDTQSLIAVSILGQMQNDAELLETAKEYMCDDMRDIVLLVNKYLYSSSGKKALAQMKNPPAYKPKKEKKPGMFAQMMGAGGADGMMPPM